MPTLFEKIQAKIELFRLEQRYTRNRHRRSAFISNAIYVDGEYIYQTPNATGSSTNSSSTANSSAVSSPVEEESPYGSSRRRSVEVRSNTYPDPQTPAQKKRLNRFSSMPGFGSGSSTTKRREWRPTTYDVREVR
ncbi:hypothetical protein GGS23DRAFT_515934 [Durotheca rogersii]|uniref:uncharacterized protein n=1 Tax=Durotheca rogersii TaxID=419775 RepID=UPI00221ED0F2|nr:uncharacterized protein GGS23DRAFT_515934 [Durotheca rogersii]KAI5863826.1 hypothetical protein GGS23DRAFT_515934 [Durotheca rogersii]